MGKQTVGSVIATLRKELGLTQRELAGMTGGKIKPTQLANYEQGIREPGLEEIKAIALALKVAPGFITGFTPLRKALCNKELDLIRLFRKLPESEKTEYLKKIRAISIIFSDTANPSFPAVPSETSNKVS